MFFIIPFSFSPYEVPKVLVVVLFIGILTITVILNGVKRNEESLANASLKQVKRSFAIAQDDKVRFLIFICFILYTSYFILLNSSLLWGNEIRPQGTLIYLCLFLLFFIAKKLPFDLNLASKIASFTLPLLLFFTVLIGPRASFRFIGPLGEANALGAAILFLFPFTNSIKNKKLKILCIISATLLIIMTGSRIALLAFIVEVLIIYFKNFRLIFIPGIIITALVFIFSVIYPFIPREVPEDYRLRFENRSEIWTMSYLAGFDSPILGQGFGSAEEAINKKAFELNNFIKYQRIDNAHNLFLNWWIMGGGIGLIILILLISVSLRNLYQQKNWVLFSILLGLLMVQFFNPVSIVSLIHFWFILGLANS